MKKSILIAFTLMLSSAVVAQKQAPKDWFLLDPKADKVYGTGVEEAYKTLGDRPSKKVIVAVIDSGVEIDHEDLEGKIWVNEGEIAGNGIDDDGNGYIDDVHGWSFIGGPGGEIDGEATELGRMYNRLAPTYAEADEYSVHPEDREEYETFKKIEQDFMDEMNDNWQQYQTMIILSSYIDNVEKQTGMPFSKKANKAYKAANEMESGIQGQMKYIMKFAGGSIDDFKKELNEGAEHFGKMLQNNQMNVDSIRRATVGDDPNNITEKYYGCNRVEGPDALHGTHVSGIIAANRDNGKGIRGEAQNVVIMAIRAIPDGDERDKDVANAILYAVDNGASIINMSFGKYYSPHKELVDAAVKYAASKDVLIVHAAGNDAQDSDKKTSYPTRMIDGKAVSNWIEVGANSYKKGKHIPADFSNYGKTHVDLFGPGVDIYSTVIDGKYIDESGTSMACPSVVGVAALIRSYFPELTAPEVREVLMKTVTPYTKKVLRPGGEMVETKKGAKQKDVKVPFTTLCVSGGMVNANNAVKYLLSK